MLTTKWTTKFKRDYKRESAGQHKAYFAAEFKLVSDLLVAQKVLPARYRDHKIGNMRDLHIRPDLVLIYWLDSNTVYFERIGSHPEVFG